VRVLLDTHALVWAAHQSVRLGSSGRQLVADADRRLVPAVSIWELTIKQHLRKLSLASDVRRWSRRGTTELALDHLPVTADHAAAVETLPDVHLDPFGRLPVAQAVSEGAVLLTADERLLGYGDVVRLVG
jgi:PIN domain nuclease of toxin-antitoxin system